jgi:hypothetical protein
MYRRGDAPPPWSTRPLSTTPNAVAVLPKEMRQASANPEVCRARPPDARVSTRVARGLQPKHSRVGVHRRAGEPLSVLTTSTVIIFAVVPHGQSSLSLETIQMFITRKVGLPIKFDISNFILQVAWLHF